MDTLNLDDVQKYIDDNIEDYYHHQVELTRELTLDKLLRHNPYLLINKKVTIVSHLVEELLGTYLSSSEEKLFGDFLEGLAVFIAGKTCGGHKSAATGVDLEFMNDGIHYVVSIKSGPNWGNSSQQNKLQQDLQKAVATLKQTQYSANVQAVLGICYDKTRTSYLRGYLKVVGQNFWYLISENKDLYTDIIEPIGYRARQHNDAFFDEKCRVVNLFTKKFINDFCDDAGNIDWIRLVEWNSGNFDLDHFMSGK